MITERNIERLDNLVAKYALQDYKRANPKRRAKHRPYTLSPRTNEAREMLILARKKNPTQDEETAVKAYLLKQALLGEE